MPKYFLTVLYMYFKYSLILGEERAFQASSQIRYNTKKEHFPIIHPKFSRDFAFHFAVGYPF